MFDVGYFPPNTPPDNIKVGVSFEYCTRIRSKALLAAFIAAPRVGYS
jgi:hypothetical protein